MSTIGLTELTTQPLLEYSITPIPSTSDDTTGTIIFTEGTRTYELREPHVFSTQPDYIISSYIKAEPHDACKLVRQINTTYIINGLIHAQKNHQSVITHQRFEWVFCIKRVSEFMFVHYTMKLPDTKFDTDVSSDADIFIDYCIRNDCVEARDIYSCIPAMQ